MRGCHSKSAGLHKSRLHPRLGWETPKSKEGSTSPGKRLVTGRMMYVKKDIIE
jgi:hypothetical protein